MIIIITYLVTYNAHDFVPYQNHVHLGRICYEVRIMESLVITKKKRGEDGYKVFSVRLKEETLDRLNTLCQDTGRTRNELIGMLLDFALQHSKVAADK